MGDKGESHSIGRRISIAAGLLLFLLTLGIFAAVIAGRMRSSELKPLLTITVNGDFTLKLMAVRTPSSYPLMITPWQYGPLENIAELVGNQLGYRTARRLDDYLTKYQPESYASLLDPDSVELIFFVDWPGRNEHYGSAPQGVVDDVMAALESEKMLNLRFKRGEHVLSDNGLLYSTVNTRTHGWTANHRLVLATTLDDVDAIAKQVELHFVESFLESAKSSFVATIENPLYEKTRQ